jgi:hypothetical protein
MLTRSLKINKKLRNRVIKLNFLLVNDTVSRRDIS